MRLRTLLITAVVALGLIAAPVVTTQFSPVTEVSAAATTGKLAWGGRKGLTDYIGGPQYVTVSEGATKLPGDYIYDWPFVSSDYDPATKTGSVNFRGKVDWHHEGYDFHVIISNPSFVYKDGVGKLVADVRITYPDDNTFPRDGRGPYWDLTDTPAVVNGNTISWTNVATTVNDEGDKHMNPFYVKGYAYDPATFSFTK
ncbi:hypothetical protein D5S17_12005 [Pseudonocardiaceae bacterium YIM PH 21723]|nr:hypothetical protein D5S17_12005 [Pseudonocardiaceae bacterium YIM PH 21723]